MTDTAGIKPSNRIKRASAAIKATSGVDEYYALLRGVEALERMAKMPTVPSTSVTVWKAMDSHGVHVICPDSATADAIANALTHKEPT